MPQLDKLPMLIRKSYMYIILCCDNHDMCKTGGTNILLVRPAYNYSIVLIVLIVFVLKALINLYVRLEY